MLWRRLKDRSGWRAAPLFDGMSVDELDALGPLVRERKVRKRELVAREGDLAQELYVVKSGVLEFVKRDGDQERLLGEVKPGEVAGEVALFDELPRFASLRAAEPSEVYVLAVRDLRPPARGRDRRPRPLKRAYQRIRERLTEVLADKVRDHDDAALAHARHREAVGTFLVHVLVMVCLYSFLLSGLELLGERAPANTTLVSIPLQLLFAIAGWRIIRSSGYPLREFGLGFRQLVGSVIEAAVLTPLLLALATGIKWVILTVRHSPVSLVEHPNILARLAEPEVVRRLAIYALSCAVQELIVRGALQSSLERFLHGRRAVLQSVLIAALLFSMMHLHMSFLFAVLAFVPGLFWGWLFARRRHLLGVTLSHVAVGAYVFFVLGVAI